jgi:hypothetical protein
MCRAPFRASPLHEEIVARLRLAEAGHCQRGLDLEATRLAEGQR